VGHAAALFGLQQLRGCASRSEAGHESQKYCWNAFGRISSCMERVGALLSSDMPEIGF
jgi:hypothetical protein